MKKAMKKLEEFLELGGIKKDITLLVIGGIALLLSIFHVSPLPFDLAWISIILCGVPIILEAGDESWKRQFHSANDPTGTVRRCRKNQNCGYRRPMGNLDRGDRTFRSNIYLYHFRRLIRAVTILVVFCPCALVLATPTAIMAAIGNTTKHGFLVRASIGKSSSKLLQRVLSEKSAGSRNV